MNLHAGTSGFAYKAWKGAFYPDKLPAGDMLRYYASRLPAVEINNTFYRLPSERVLLGWAEQVPEGFQFVLKASRRITHNARLAADDAGALDFFLRTANVLGPRLGPTLFQLPPTMKKDMARLGEFLGRLPRRWRAGLEFRHPSWFDEEVYAALREHDLALVMAEDDEASTPLVATTAWGYLRLRRTRYAPDEIMRWAERIRAQPWREAYVFFKHEDDVELAPGKGPLAAAALIAEAGPA